MRITGEVSVAHMATAATIYHRPAQPRTRLPQKIWPEQEFSALAKGFDRYSATPNRDFATLAPLGFHLYELKDAWFAVGNGVDGLILTANGEKVAEPSCFTDGAVTKVGADLATLGLPVRGDLDDAYVGFDGAWHNYFHFLCYALARCHAAEPCLPPGCQMVIPEYEERPGGFEIAYRQATYEQAIRLSGLAERLTRLPMGLYRAKTLRFLWSVPRQPTEFLEIPQFSHMFAGMRRHLRHRPDAPRRLLLSRAGARDPRIGQEAAELVQGMCLARGFTVMRFEEMDLIGQAEALFNADCIVAPHGAGLVNTLFGRDELRVLELGSELDGDGSLRACFYQTATNRGQPYMILNGTAGEIEPERLAMALEKLCG